MKRAAIYARFSSDLQKDRSINDQVALCERLAQRHDLKIVRTFSDRAKSGASMFDRDGLIDLMREAKERRFDVVVVESLDRLSRDQEDLAGLHKRLNFLDIEILTDNEGATTPIHVGIRGILGSLFLKDLGAKTRRGQSELAREGKVPGSVAYGYRIVLGKKGEPEIDPDKAKIVRRIYAEYLRGTAPRAIAIGLTRDGIPSPAGGKWNAPTIAGGGQARYGILTNPIYVGSVVWNKTKRVRNPETGTKLKRATPEEQIKSDAPHLRIIDQATWDAAQTLRESRARVHFGPTGRVKRNPFLARTQHLLAGMLRCGVCGGHMRNKSMTRGVPYAACAAADAHDSCTHRQSYDLDRMQTAILAGMKEHLTNPEAIIEATRAYHARWTDRNKKNRTDAATLRKQLSRIEVQVDRIVTAITDSDEPVKQLTMKLKALEVERVGLAERLRLIEAETNVVDLHPGVMKAYQENVTRLHKALSENALTPENRAAFRNLIDSIVVHPTDKRMPYEFTPYGRLGAIMGNIDLFPEARTTKEILSKQGVELCDTVKSGNSGLPASHKVIPLGRWRAKAA